MDTKAWKSATEIDFFKENLMPHVFLATYFIYKKNNIKFIRTEKLLLLIQFLLNY
jgi:hypothetical protein